jgi:hypothetical protein
LKARLTFPTYLDLKDRHDPHPYQSDEPHHRR